MSTVLTIGGTPVVMTATNSFPVTLNLRFDAYSTLVVKRRGGPLVGLPDPWLGQPAALAIGGVTYFKGDCTDAEPAYTAAGWETTYLFRDLKAHADQIPFTDANTLTDSAAYNIAPDDPLSILSREGRTVGQILTDVLLMTANATALDAAGLGAYTSLGPPPVLPASTVADLAALTVIPPSGVYVGGEKFFCAIGAFIKFWAPNHTLWIEPATGAIRILDKRLYVDHTFTMGTDPVDPTPLRRSVGDCFQRVLVRGQPIAEPKMVTTKLGTLAEDFAFGTTTNAAAKAAYTPADSIQNKTARSDGTCTCTDTLNVVVTPTDTAQHWIADFWDQTTTGHQGSILLTYSVGTGIHMTISRRIVANAALTPGGSSSIQVDLPLPATNYDHFAIYGIINGQGFCYKRYKIVDPDIAAAMASQFTYPQAWVGSSGAVSVSTSYPMGSVCYSASGDPPYAEFPDSFTQDPASQHIYFLQSTYILAGNHEPSDVRALLAVNTGVNTAVYPPDSGGPVYAGTSHTIEGLTDTLTVSVGEWRDPINTTAMTAFAHDVLDSVKDSIVEGSVVYHGLYLPALTPGAAVSVTGTGYTTGWEGLALPILEVELTWNSGSQTQYTTTMHCSNRRAHFSAAAFLKPSREAGGQHFLEGGSNLFGLGTAQMIGMAQASQANMQDLTTAPDQTQSGDPADWGIEGPGKQGQTAASYNRDIDKLTGDYKPTQKEEQHARRVKAQQEKADEKANEQFGDATSASPQTAKQAQEDRAYNAQIAEQTSRKDDPKLAATEHARDFERQAKLYNSAQRQGDQPRAPDENSPENQLAREGKLPADMGGADEKTAELPDDVFGGTG